jgi:catechol 2,3-dioxygenase-like lactoylglutathione lyase family enzyme
MITGAHVVLYSSNAALDRDFLRDVIGFPHVDAGDGWLIFRLPTSEAAVHPGDADDGHELFLMTDNVDAEIARLSALGIKCGPVMDQGWGRLTSITLPSGGHLGLYEPRHPQP